MSEMIDEEMEIELPPALQKFLSMLEADQRKLLKDKSFSDPNELRKFVATTLIERMAQITKMFGVTMYDQHQTLASNTIQLNRMRRWVADHLRGLGAEVNDEAFAGIGTEEVDAMGQAMYALGSYLQSAYPDDKQAQTHYNNVAQSFNQLVAALMGNQSFDEEGEEDDDDETEGSSDADDEAGPGEAEDDTSADSPTDSEE